MNGGKYIAPLDLEEYLRKLDFSEIIKVYYHRFCTRWTS